jgi:primosomal protein N' (replication factor Y) (superfamily II helicase)
MNFPMKCPAAAYARIVVASPVKDALIYRIPDELRGQVVAGMRVVVPLGKRQVTGVILELLAETPLAEIKEIISIQDELPVLDPTSLQLMQWMARYYLTNMGEVLGTILPPSLRRESVRTVIAGKDLVGGLSPLEVKILQAIHKNKGKADIKILRRLVSGPLYPALERLQLKGAVEIRERWPGKRRRPAASQSEPSPAISASEFALAGEQQSALAAIREPARDLWPRLA